MKVGQGFWNSLLIVAVTAATQAVAGETLTGTVTADPSLQKKAKPGAVLYVIARTSGAAGGPPLAVTRIPNPKFPQSFSIGPENRMMVSIDFTGPLRLQAKLSQDGNAMTKSGDLLGTPVDGLKPGQSGVTLKIDKEQP